RRVAVRVELADHVAHGARGFLVLGRRREPELAHRVDDAALQGLQAVAHVRPRAGEDHVRRVLLIRARGDGTHAQTLYPREIEGRLVGARGLARRHGVAPPVAAAASGSTAVARLPLVSSHSRRSEARFLASIMSMTWSAWSAASTVSCTRRRVSGAMVVSRSCSGFISPRPLKRVTTGLARGFSARMRSRMPLRSASSRAYSTCLP